MVFWVKRIGNVDYLVFFDCTGHGVPGAFMTLIVTSVLDQIAVAAPAALPAARILQNVHDGVCRQLGITPDTPGHDGLDCAVVRLDRSEDSLEFAGASIDLFEIGSNGDVTRHRGSRLTLGYRRHDAMEWVQSSMEGASAVPRRFSVETEVFTTTVKAAIDIEE